MGSNIYIGHNTILKGYQQNEFTIGDDTWIGQQSFFHSAGGLHIGSRVGIGPAVKIITSYHKEEGADVPILYSDLELAEVLVEDDCDIGVGAIILPGVKIGKGSLVGAGAGVASRSFLGGCRGTSAISSHAAEEGRRAGLECSWGDVQILKVLHLPYNVASQVSATVQGLRAIGVDARGLVVADPGHVLQSHEEIEILADAPSLPRSIRWVRGHARRYAQLLSAIAWADVLHWHFGYLVLRGGFDLRWARFLNKPGVAEFWGSDIRVADIEAADNPYFGRYAPVEYRAQQTYEHSFETQAPFARAGFSCIVSGSAMLNYVRQELFPRVELVRPRLVLSSYEARPPDPRQKRPLVVHSPSNPKLKGTEFVQAAVDRLHGRYDFEFRLVHGVPRFEAMAILSKADIFVDQLLLGEHGLAALEAMALAKPVVCYIKPSMLSQYPASLPIVCAGPDNIGEALQGLLTSGERRQSLGLQGRAYVEEYHDALKLAHQLKAIYAQTVAGSGFGT